MTKDKTAIKQKTLTKEDLKIIESDPTGLADYIATCKVREARKTAFIFMLLMAIITFMLGLFTGTNITGEAINNSSVKVEVALPKEAEAPAQSK